MELDDDDGQRRRVEEAVEERASDVRPALRHGVEHRPGRVRDDLRDERPDVVDGDRRGLAVEGELVQLARGEGPLAEPVDVALAHEAADPSRELLGGVAVDDDLALPGEVPEPACELARLRRGERLRLAARLDDRGLEGLEHRRALRPGVALLHEDQRIAGRDGAQ
jgi:hypothetical protein